MGRRRGSPEKEKKRASGETWVCIATGPSLDQEQCDLIRRSGLKTCAINDAYKLAPWADLLYACDYRWWQHHIAPVRQQSRSQLWTVDKRAAKEYGINHVDGHHGNGLASSPPIVYGMNSGYQAIGLVYALFNASKVILVGYDMGYKNGQTHFFGDHPSNLQVKSPWPAFMKHYATMDPERHGLKVINSTIETALGCFPRQKLEDALRG